MGEPDCGVHFRPLVVVDAETAAKAAWERAEEARERECRRTFAIWVECYPEEPGPKREACVRRERQYYADLDAGITCAHESDDEPE